MIAELLLWLLSWLRQIIGVQYGELLLFILAGFAAGVFIARRR